MLIRILCLCGFAVFMNSNLACARKTQKTPIGKNANKLASQPEANALMKILSKSKSCLPLKAVIDELTRQSQKIFVIHTYDVDVGTLSPISNNLGLRFTSSRNKNLKTHIALQGKYKPKLATMISNELTTSALVSDLLGVWSQKGCEEVAFGPMGPAQENYKIIGHSYGRITAQNQRTGEVRSYFLKGFSQLVMTRFSNDSAVVCGQALPYKPLIKETTILSWGPSLQSINLKRSYAETLASHTRGPFELTEALRRSERERLTKFKSQKSSNGVKPDNPSILPSEAIGLSYPSFDFIVRLIEKGRIEKLNCN